jgi:hypothetical protein
VQGSKTIPIKGKRKSSRVSNRVTVDSTNPIPFDFTGQTFSFVHQSAYLPFLPPKDNFGQMLLEARLNSPTHGACIRTKKDYCAGDGFADTKGAELDPAILDWFKAMNLKNQSATKLNKNILEDFFTWGNVPIELVRFSVAGKKKLFIYAHSFLEWRLGKPDLDDICQYAVQSKLFLRNAHITADIIKQSKKLPIYNPNLPERKRWFKDENGVERTLLWYKSPYSGFPYYGLPTSIESFIDQVLEYKGARYDLDNIDNNMVIGALLALKGNLSQGEADRIGKKIIDTHVGDGKRGRVAVVASEEGIEGSEYHKMETKAEGSFIEADKKWIDKIILSNQWDAVLAGIVSPSSLGKGSGFLTKIIEHKLNTVIIPAQKDLVDEVWAYIFEIAEEWLGLPFSKYQMAIHNNIDISGLTDVDITPAVQINEVRLAKKLPEDPAMKGVYMKATAPAQPKQGGEDV